MSILTSYQGKTGTGTSSWRVPVPLFFWPACLAFIAASLLDLPLTDNGYLAAAAGMMLLGGLPHGAFDIAIATSTLRLRRSAALLLLACYIAVAGGMLLLWAGAPILALSLFLSLAAVHFGEDWRMLDAGLLRTMAGASIICIPAFAHPDSVSALFVAMSGESATWVARVIVALTPVAVLVTLVGMWQAMRMGNGGWALAQFAALASLAALPPQMGFLLYFVFLHSPLHMRGITQMLPDWSDQKLWIYGGLICLICFLAAWVLAPGLFSGQSMMMSADAFRLLSVVAAPHLLLTLYLARSGVGFGVIGGQTSPK
jgi:Brp/Blh family beta-carotene 15,15'-monooxygenase